MLFLPFSLLFGLLGYRHAQAYRLRTGQDPAKASPVIWAFVCGLSFLGGTIALWLATRRDPDPDVAQWLLLRRFLAVVLGLLALGLGTLALVSLREGLPTDALACLAIGAGLGTAAWALLRRRTPRAVAGRTFYV